MDDQIANLIVAQLIHLESRTPTRTSRSTSTRRAAWRPTAIYDTMQYIKPDVQTICVGIAMSMARPARGRAQRRWRCRTPRSSSTRWPAFQGQATDIEIQAREVISLKRRLEEIFAQHTEQSLDKVSKDMERDYFMTPQEAQEYKIIDRVVAHRGAGSAQPLAETPISRYKQRRGPRDRR